MRRYRNGVEIKPSEYTIKEKSDLRKAAVVKKKTGVINESRLSDSGSDHSIHTNSDEEDAKKEDTGEDAEQLTE